MKMLNAQCTMHNSGMRTGAQGRRKARLGWAAAVVIAAAGVLLSGARDAWADTAYYRSESCSSGNWEWDTSPRPWWFGGAEHKSPDDGSVNDVHFNNNTHTNMTLNGRWFSVGYLEFESGASQTRTIGKSGNAGINLRYGLKNLASVEHVFNAPVSFDEAQSVWAQNGSFTFNEPLYLNQAVTFDPSSSKTITAAKIVANANGTLTKAGAGTMTATLVTNNNASFRIKANDNVGDLTVTQMSATTNASYAVEVGYGSKVTIGTMFGNGTLRKSGVGTLEIGTANSNTRGIGVWGGTVIPRSGGTFITCNFTNFAAGAFVATNANVLHLDATTLFNRIVFTNTTKGAAGKFIIESKVTSASACATLQATNVWNLSDKVTVKFIPDASYSFNSAASATWDIFQTVRKAGQFTTGEVAQITIDGSALGVAGTNCFALSLVNTTIDSSTLKRIIRVTYTPPVVKPTMTDGGASGISSTGATVSGSGLNAGGASTTVTFGYGTASGSYTNSATVTGSPFAAGTTSGAPSVSLTGLEPGTKYYYQWTLTNSKGAQTYTGSFTTSATAPTVTTGSATGITTNQATLSATVTANGGAALTANGAGVKWGTSSGTYTTGSATYSGTPTVNTPFQVTATGLTPGTRYYYVGYAANSVGTGTTPTASEGSFYTKCSTPTAPTGLSIARTSQVKLTPSWTAGAKGTGGGTLGYVVLVNASDETPPSLTDGTVYSAGDDLGDGWSVVGTTTSTSLPASGLTKDTVYYFAVYSYAGVSGQASTYAYSTSATALTGSQFTENSTPSNWTATFTTNAQGTSATISWSAYAGANSFDGYVLLLRAGTAGASTPPGNDPQPASPSAQKEGEDDFWEVGDTSGTGTTVIYMGTETSTTVSGLTPLTGYKVRVLAYDGDHYRTYKSGGVTGFITTEKTGPDVWATGVDAESFLLNWTEVEGATTGYDLETGNGAPVVLLDEGFTTDGGWVTAPTNTSGAKTAASGKWTQTYCGIQATTEDGTSCAYPAYGRDTGALEFPVLTGTVTKVKAYLGATDNSTGTTKGLKLQSYNGSSWTDLQTFSGTFSSSSDKKWFTYTPATPIAANGLRLRLLHLNNNTVYIYHVRVEGSAATGIEGHSKQFDGLTSGTSYTAKVRKNPGGDWSDTLSVKAGVMPSGLGTNASTRNSVTFGWTGLNSPVGYLVDATYSGAATNGWTSKTPETTTIGFSWGSREWCFTNSLGTTVTADLGGSGTKTVPCYNATYGWFLGGVAGNTLMSTNFPIGGATNISLSFRVGAWNLKAGSGAGIEMGRVNAYYRLDDGAWNFLGTAIPSSAEDEDYSDYSVSVPAGGLDGTNIAFKITAPKAELTDASGGTVSDRRQRGPYLSNVSVTRATAAGTGYYGTNSLAGYPTTVAGTTHTLTGLESERAVFFRVQALQGSTNAPTARSVWVEATGETGGFTGPTPSVEGTGRHEVTASWAAYDGEDAGDYNISYKVQLTGCASGGEPEEVSVCPASGRAYGSSTTEWTYQRAYSGGTASSYPSWSSPWHRLWGQFASTTVYPGLESPEMDLTGYEKGYVEFSHNYINQKTNSEVELYWKIGDGGWTKWADTPRAQYSAAANATKRNIELPDEVIGQTRVKVKLVAWKAVNYDSDPDPEVTSYMVQGASVFGARVMAQGAGGGKYDCDYTSDEYTTTGTSFTFNAETLAGDSRLTGLMAGSNYYVHVLTVLTPKTGGAATTSEWGEDGNGTTAAPQLPPAEVWVDEARQQHLTVAWDAADGADENTQYRVQVSSCQDSTWTSVGVQPSATNADLTVDDDWQYVGGGADVTAGQKTYITGRDEYPAYAGGVEMSQVLAGDNSPGLESVEFSTVGASWAKVTFGHGRWYNQSDLTSAPITVSYSTDGGESWTDISTTTYNDVPQYATKTREIDLPDGALGKSRVKVRLEARSATVSSGTPVGCAVRNATVTMGGAVGDYDTCLVRDVAGLSYDQLSLTLGDLTNNTTYYFRVAASDGTQYGSWVNGMGKTLNVPSAPDTAPWATAIGRHTMTIQWVAGEGAETYTLEVYTNAALSVLQERFEGVVGTEQKVTGLDPDKTYWFRVRSHADGTSSTGWSATGNAKTVTDVSVTGLHVEDILETSMTLKWDYVDGTTYTLHWGPTVTNGATDSREERIACPAKTLERSDAGNGWFYLGGNGDYPAYWTSSGNPTNDQGHALIYATGGKPAMQSRWFSTYGATNATVEFLHGRFNAGADSTVLVQYSVDGGASWATAGTADSTAATNPSVARAILLPQAALGRRSVAVRLTATGASGTKGAHLKDVQVVVRSGSTGEGTEVLNAALGSTGSYPLTGLTKGTRYWFEMTASEAGDTATAETTAATRTKTTGALKSQGFEGLSAPYGALDTTRWGYTIKYNDVGTDTWRAEGSRLATDPKVEVVADENPLYGDRALRMSGSTNAAAFGVVEFDNVSLGEGGAASVTVPFASRNLASGENLWFSYSTNNGTTWQAPVAKTTNRYHMAKIGMGGSDAINQSWPYNHGSNTTTRPQGDAYVFETNGITQLKIRIAFCGNARSADHYYYLDGVTVKRLPGTPTGATAVAQEDGSMLLGWTPPAGQSVVILRGRDERHVPQSPIDLENLPSGYELVTQAGGSPYFANGTTTFYDREVTSGWKYYYYFYGAMDNGDGTYSLSTECATANDVVKGMVTTIASQGWDGWDVHPWGYKKGRVTNPGARSDGGWWKTNGMNNVDVAFLESWETDARDSTGPSGQYYADYYGTGLGATDADRTNQLGITSKTNYYGDHSFRLSGGGSYWWAAGNLSINTNNAAVQFDNVDLSGYKNVQFSMHIAATNLGLGGDDLHVAISTNGGTDWVAVSSTNAAKWAVVPSSLDYGLEVIDGNHGNGGDWDFYFESFEPVEYTYNGNPATSIPTPEGNPYVLHVPDSVTQMMVRVMFYDSNGGSKRKMSYFIDEVRLTGDVALETPHPTMENITSNSFVVAWDPIEGASTYDVRVTKCEAAGDDAVLRTESFVLNLVTNGWTTNTSGSATLSSGAAYNHTGSSGYGLIMGGNGTELTSPEIGAMRQVSFWGKTSGANSNSKLLVQVSEDGTHWETVTNYVAAGNVTPTATQIASGSWVQKTVDLPHRQWARVRLRMERSGTGAGNFYIDDIRILGGGDYDADGCMVKEVTGVTGTSQGFTNGVGGVTIAPGTNYFVEVKAHGTLAGNPTHSSWGETGDYTTGDFAIRPDGFEMVRMTWAAASGGILVMAVPEGDDFSDVSAPTNTTVGGINGKGVVLENTTSAKTGAGFEHVRPYGSRTEDYEAKYVVYWKHGSYWEGRLETSVTLPAYPGVAEDTFAVTNLTTGANLNTYSAAEGKGWAGGWSVWDGAASKVSVTTGTAMVTGTYTNYGLLGTNRLVGAGGNMIHFNMNSDTMTARVCRVLSSPLSTEEVWVMATMRSQYGTEAAHEDKMFGVQLFSSAETLSESIFATVGKMKWLYGGKPRLGIDKGVSGSMPPGDVTWSGEAGDYTYNMTDTGHEGSKGSHTLVMKYEPAKGDLYVAAFSNVATHASSGALRPDKAAKPTTWAVYKQGVADDNTPLAGVILFGYGYHGALDFDEVRVGSSWDEIVGVQTEPPQNVATAQAWTDGNELVRIAWQYAGGVTNDGVVHPLADGVKIFAKEGTGEGTWTEIYKGKGTNTVVAKDGWSRWDHVVAPGSTHEYKVVAYASSKYTNGVVAVNRDTSPDTAVTTGLYGDTEYVNPFAYTNWSVASTAAGSRWLGGNGFGDNYWAPGDGSAGTWSIATPEEAQSAVHITNGVYGSRPAAGNVLKVVVGDVETASINRTLDGDAWYGKQGQTFYVAFRMAYQWGDNAGRQVGLRLTDDTGKYVQFGKARGDDSGYQHRFGVTASPNGTGYSSAWSTSGDDMTAYGNSSASQAYLVVGKVNWSSDGKANLRGVKYVIGTNGTPATLPGEEKDVSWEASYDNAGIGAIRKIELIAGTEGSGNGTIGTAWFDEIRFGPTWEDIVGATEPEDTWVDGIGVVGEGGTDGTARYLGDYVQWYMYGWPKGPKQSAWVTLATDNTFATVLATNGTSWVTNTVDNRDGTGRLQTKWQGGEVQFTQTDNVYAGGSVKGELVTLHSWQRPAPYGQYGHKWNVYNVLRLPVPTGQTAVGGTARATLGWTPATENGRTFTEVMVVRYTGDGAAPAPVQGTTYLKGQSIGTGTVVYRGTATSLVDKGLTKSTTYHYLFFTVNNSYYSAAATADATTDANDPEIVIDGDPTDWVGLPSETKNSSTVSANEWIWTDKVLDGRVDKPAAYDADITEFRMKVDTNGYVNFMVRLNCMTNKQNPYISVGIVTNVDATRLAETGNEAGENWIGDESATFMGGNLFAPASLHYADLQMAVHWVTTAGEDGVASGSGGWVVELYKKDGNSWFAPAQAWEAESSANGAADACIEWKVKRADLGLAYANVTPARFTVASFANGGGWNNDTEATVDLSSGKSHAVDTLAIAPWGVNDKDLALSAWDEGIKDGNAEYWFDIWFGPTALHNAAPNAPASYLLDGNPAYNGQLVTASPTMRWSACADHDDIGGGGDLGFVVGYLVEVSTNEYFNGLEGTTENGPISCRVNLEGATNTSYRFKTDSRYYWWRVRARDNSGALSAPTPWSYEVTGKTDNEGPVARLLFVGKDEEVAQYVSDAAFRHEQDMSGDGMSVLDSDLEDGGHSFGFVIEWYDVNGVFATNWYREAKGDGDQWPKGTGKNPYNPSAYYNPSEGDFAWSIQSHHGDGTPFGRVSPNWDLVIVDRSATNSAAPTKANETVGTNTIAYTWTNNMVLPTDDGGTETISCWIIDCGLDRVFQPTQTINTGNDGQYVTNHVQGAFSIGTYRTDLDIYLTVSAEDGCKVGANAYAETADYDWPLYAENGSTGSYQANNSPSFQVSGWCAAAPNPSRNVTTNQLLHIHVRDNDTEPPVTSQAKWRADATSEGGTALLPMMAVAITNSSVAKPASWTAAWSQLAAVGRVPTQEGQGKALQWQLTDGDVANGGTWYGGDKKLRLFFNVYDEYLHSGLASFSTYDADAPASGTLGAAAKGSYTSRAGKTRELNNTGLLLGTTTNWTGFLPEWSLVPQYPWDDEGDNEHGAGTGLDSVLAWQFDATESNLEALLGQEDPLSNESIGIDGTTGEQRVVTNSVKLFAWDNDNNAAGDQEGAELEFGQLLFTDDDATAPAATLELKGTGTNFTHFGKVAEWTWGDGKTADPRTNGLKGVVASNAAGWIATATANPTNDTPSGDAWKWAESYHAMYHQNGMGGTEYRSAAAKYVRFDMHGPTGSVWRTDMAGFHNRVSKLGPTIYTLTVQAPDNSITHPALTGTELTEGWAKSETTTVETHASGWGGKSPTINLWGASTTPTLTSPGISLKAYHSGVVTFTYGYIRTKAAARNLLLEWTKDNWTTHETITYPSTNFASTAANGGWSNVTFAVPMVANENATIQFRWSGTGTGNDSGFALHDARIKMLAGDDSEVELATVVVEKNLGDDGSYLDTTNEVTMGFGGKMVENGNGAWHIFRLYGYGATTMDDSVVSPTNAGTWGINNFYLHGTLAEPKRNEVTDHDLRMGAWTNALTAADGGMVGYDTARSGLWVTGGGTNVPSFTLRYPDGGEVITSTNVLRTAATAEIDAMEDDFTGGGVWVTAAGAEIDAKAGRLVLPEGGTQSWASATLPLTPKADATGLTASGSLRVKAETAAGSGGVNGLEALVEFLNGAGGTLDSETQTFTAVHAPRTWTLRPIETTLTGVESVRLTVRQATAAGTTVWVDGATLEVAQWGETVSAEDTAAWAATVTNGMPAAKFTVGTPELTSLTNVTLTLSEDIEGTNKAYRITERVNDWDKDRDDDWLAGTAEERFELFDDDYMSPTNGSMFGGPLGVFLNGTILPPKQRTGSGTGQKWVITDQALTGMGADDPVLFSLSYYDYSGWRTKELSLGTAKLQTGGAAASPYTQVTAEGLADVPSATNAWTVGARTLYTAHETAFNTVAGSTLPMTATVADLDEDRANDSLERVDQVVGQVVFFDQDVDAPEYGYQTEPYYGVMVATNVAADGKDDLLAGNSEWVLGGSLALHQGKPAEGETLADTRAFTVYDGQLRQVAADSKFTVTANLNDPRHHSENGRAVSGLQRGTEANGVQTNSLWGTSYETTNSYVAFETAAAGSEGWAGRSTALTNVVCDEAFSEGIGRTRNAMQPGHTSWTWDAFSWAEVGLLLPSGEARDLYLNVYAFDSDTNRPGDQMAAVLAGPKITVRDDDTQGPTAPTGVSVAGRAVAEGEVTRENAPWTNSLTGAKLAFTAATDPAFGNKAGDIKTAGIARYHLAEEGAAIGTNAVTGTNLVLTVTTNASTGKLEANLGTVSMPQGWGTRKLYAVDADDDRPGDGMAGATADVPLAYDITLPTKIGSGSARLEADPDSTDDPTTQFDLTWPIADVGPDDSVGDEAHYKAIPQKYKDVAPATNDVLSPWATYKIYYTNYEESAIAEDDDPSSQAKSWVYTNFVATANYKSWQSVSSTNTSADPTAGANPYESLTNVTENAGASSGKQRIRLYDLDFDQHYIVVIVGVDKAGNEGPAGMWSWATNNTIKFAVTQGVVRTRAAINAAVGAAGGAGTNSVGMVQIADTNATHGATLYWLAAGQTYDETGARTGPVSKYYDLIYWDAPSFNETGREAWTNATSGANSGTAKTNWNYQAGDFSGIGRNNLRFFRASYQDRWRTKSPTTGKAQRPLASEEVYAMNRVALRDGDNVNLVALHGLPYTNTWRGLFGTDTNVWPASDKIEESTRVDVYTLLDGDNLVPSGAYWLDVSGTNGVQWKHQRTVNGVTVNEDVTDEALPDELFGHGFSIHLPPLEGDFARFAETTTTNTTMTTSGWWVTNTYHWMTWYPILQVPTNGPTGANGVTAPGFSVPVKYGSRRAAAYTMVSLNLPVTTHVKDMMLLGTDENPKFQPGDGGSKGDVIYMWDDENKKVRDDCLIYYDQTNGWKNSKGSGLTFRPGDVIVIMSFGGGTAKTTSTNTWKWEYYPTNFYRLPSRHMGQD